MIALGSFKFFFLSPLFLGVCPPTLSKTTSAAKSFLPSKTFQSSPKPSNSSPTSPKSHESPRASLLSPLKPFWLLPSLHRAFWDGIFEAKESPFLFFLFSPTPFLFLLLLFSSSLSSFPLNQWIVALLLLPLLSVPSSSPRGASSPKHPYPPLFLPLPPFFLG